MDYNRSQVTGSTDDILTVDPVIEFFRGYGWEVIHDDLSQFFIGDKPKVFIMNTIKGNGIKRMMDNQKMWHYRKIADQDELESLIKEIDNAK